jgi:hypothetical protein
MYQGYTIQLTTAHLSPSIDTTLDSILLYDLGTMLQFRDSASSKLN